MLAIVDWGSILPGVVTALVATFVLVGFKAVKDYTSDVVKARSDSRVMHTFLMGEEAEQGKPAKPGFIELWPQFHRSVRRTQHVVDRELTPNHGSALVDIARALAEHAGIDVPPPEPIEEDSDDA